LDCEREPILTVVERRWVDIGWPTSGDLWVAEFDTNLVPFETVYLKLPRTMDDRYKILGATI
jgi:hypothetical protein